MKPTLETLDKFTVQQVFNFVAEHLIKQGQPSLLEKNNICFNNCAYRSLNSEGNKISCAVGCLISDANYDESIENTPVASVLEQPVYRDIDISDYMMELLTDLQDIHDTNVNSWGNLPFAFKKLAEIRNLNYNER